MASTRVIASRLASSMASSTVKVARPAMRVQVANASKRTFTGKETHLELIVAQPSTSNVIGLGLLKVN